MKNAQNFVPINCSIQIFFEMIDRSNCFPISNSLYLQILFFIQTKTNIYFPKLPQNKLYLICMYYLSFLSSLFLHYYDCIYFFLNYFAFIQASSSSTHLILCWIWKKNSHTHREWKVMAFHNLEYLQKKKYIDVYTSNSREKKWE